MKLKVKTKPSYNVYIEKSLKKFNETCLNLLKGENVLIISDSNVSKLFYKKVSALLVGKTVYLFVINAGESSKNAENYLKILEFMAEKSFTREDSVITLGGGVVGDLGAFAASTYMRGINLVAMPTSLLAMIDSSVGGKTAINLQKGKNLCGTFYQPKAVYINTSFLKKLPASEVQNGTGELLKYYYLSSSRSDFDNLSDINAKLIYHSLKIKADIVAADEKEGGIRKLLNFGHTFAHAIERVSNFAVPHGLAVAKGIKLALIFSKNYYKLSGEDIIFYDNMAKSLDIDVNCPYLYSSLIEAIKSDKKRNSNYIDMILISGDKKPIIEKVLIDDILGYLK